MVSTLVLGSTMALAAGQKPASRDMTPLWKAKCLPCHSASQKQGGLSLEGTLTQVQAQTILKRVRGEGGKPRMPLSAPALTALQLGQVAAWAETAGGTHWAYAPLRRPLEPPVDVSGIDSFVLAKLDTNGLRFSPEADRTTLLRRVSLDLVGLPPTPKEVDAFLADTKPGAYERVVDRLLASPHYGERLALPWLDAARYADSNGFQQDGDTFQYVWRDWVVKALNQNMPFDQFTVEQLAGDLLPNATLDQKIATGFNRCHLLNGEGGAIPEEQRNVILFDRVDVTATTWLGVTMACAQCHDHKYDPITQKDYYRFLAYFNNVPESGVPSGGGQYRIADPFVVAPGEDDKARLKELEAQITVAQAAAKAETNTAPLPTLSAWSAYGPFTAASFDLAYSTETPLEGKASAAHPEWEDGKVQPLEPGDNAALYLVRTIHTEKAQTLVLSLGSDDAIKVWHDSKQVLANKTSRAALPDQERVVLNLHPGDNVLRLKIVNGGGIGGFYFKASGVSPAQAKLDTLTKERDQIQANLPRVMVMSDALPRKTHLLDRGNYLSPTEEVSCGTPAFLATPSAPNNGGTSNRLDLARWLVSKDNPLTARVQVNRFWQYFFGRGLVKSPENLGIQSEPPSHPELLDWLAAEFQSDWNVKRLVKQIVMSRTYRQSSKATPALIARDPENRLLARGARFRVPSLILRDVALASSGLLNDTIGGKPVYPYQPKSIWDSLSITKERDFTYPQSTGKDLYRRSLYTFWRRTVAPGNMFDASSRQACKVRASITSTPLHALTMLNDITWVEAGRVLAERVMKEGGATPEARLSEAFRRVCARRPKPSEVAILRRSYERALAAYKADPKQAVAYLKIGESPRDEKLDPAQHAAYASVCLAIYNLDEALTRE